MTTLRIHIFPIFLAIALLACSLPSCTPRVARQEPVSWDLSPKARATFAYLKFQQLKQEGSLEEAVQTLDQALDILPTPYLYLEKAELLWQSQEFGAARETLKTGIERFPEAPELYVSLAKTYEAVRRWGDASLTLEDYLRRHPDNWDLVREVGALLINQNEHAQALDKLQTIPESSRDAETWYLIGKSAANIGLQERAVHAFTTALSKDPHFFRAKAELGYLYERDKQYAEALRIYEDLAAQGEPNTHLLLTMIRLHLKLNAPDKAFGLIKQRPDDLEFQIDASTLFINQRFYSYAAGILEPLAKRDDFPSKGWFTLALLAYEGQKSPQNASAYLARIKVGDPYFERALLFRTDLSYGQGNIDQALRLADQGIQAFPEQPRFILIKASLFQEKGAWEKGAELLEKGHTTWPENIEILFSLGVLWDDQNDKNKAMEYMEKIIAIDPDYPEALNYLGYSLAEQGLNLDRALVLVNNALKQDPDNGYYMDSLAWVLFKQGKLNEAWEAIVQAVKLAKEDPTIWEHYALIAEALGKKEQARQARTKAKKFQKPQPSDD
jgi:tetratricopeptide (TPR) repeat protein